MTTKKTQIEMAAELQALCQKDGAIQVAIDRANARLIAKRREEAEFVAANVRALSEAVAAADRAKEEVVLATKALLARPDGLNRTAVRRKCYQAVERLSAARQALDGLKQRIDAHREKANADRSN